MRPTISIDWDGTLTMGDGYHSSFSDELRPGAVEFLKTLHDDFEIVIHTARSASHWGRIRAILEQEGVHVVLVSNIKVPAVAYLDDRALHFDGSYMKALAEIRSAYTKYAAGG